MVASTLRRRARIGVAGAAALVSVAFVAPADPARAAAPRAPGTSHSAGTVHTAGTSSVQCPCSIFPDAATPGIPDSGDPYGVALGVKVTPATAGTVRGVRFYKTASNTGTHTGSLWTSGGTLLATGTFTGETANGWQTLVFTTPVPVRADTTYVASYYAPNGHYAYDTGYFLNGAAGQAPITAPSDAAGGGNGVYSYNGASAFPHYSYNAANYWVDVLFDDTDIPTSPPTVTTTTPSSGATKASVTTAVAATFSAPLDTSTTRFVLTDSAGSRLPGTVAYNAAATTVTFTPGTQLPSGTAFTASVQASDSWGNAMTDPATWSFTTDTAPPAYTCPCSLFGTSTPGASSNDPNSVELGTRFTSAVNGTVTGIRFYKSGSNTGTHTGTLWSSNGTRLATGTFSGESASGWQTMTFATPVAVTAGNTYVASYHAPSGNYSYTAGYFGYAYRTYPLTAPASTSSQGNGTYGYGSTTTFPADAGNGTNYWVDVVFSAP